MLLLMQHTATVAQSVEQLIRNQQVRGSNPLGSFKDSGLNPRCLFFVKMLKVLYGLVKSHGDDT